MYLIEQDLFEQFENAASYSFIEHSGLGRYGEALSANGDIEMLKMIQCLLKPGGLMFLGVQTSKDNTSYIEYNYHRVYGHNRISRKTCIFGGKFVRFFSIQSCSVWLIFRSHPTVLCEIN